MLFAQLTRYGRDRYGLSPNDREGAGVAHQDFLRAILEHSSVEAVHLFLDGYPSGSVPRLGGALAGLRTEFPLRNIEVMKARSLPSLVKERQYVFCSSGVLMAPLAQIRLATGGNGYPICSLTHSLDIPVTGLFFSGALLLAQPFDRIIASSEAGFRTIENLIDAAIDFARFALALNEPPPRPRIVKIPLGVDEAFLTPMDQQLARKLLGFAVEDRVLLYLGRLSAESKADLEPLLVVFRRLLEDCPQALLVLAGQDGEDQYSRVLETLAEGLGIKHRVRLMTNFPFFAKPLIYTAADLFLSPVDNVQETFGLSVLEAMSCGLPVVASDWSGYRDLVAHEETGFLVPTLWDSESAEAISRIAPICSTGLRRKTLARHTVISVPELYRYIKVLLDNEELRKRFGAAGRRRVLSEFAWEVVIKRHEQVWLEQWSEIRSLTQSPATRLLEDFTRLWGHYASRVIPPDLRVTCASDGIRKREDLRSPHFDAPDLEASKLLAVLDACEGRTASLEELIRPGGPGTTECVSWLLKKGYLEAV